MASRGRFRSALPGGFWIGALCGAAAASIAARLLQLGRPRLTLIHGKKSEKAEVYCIPLRRDAAAGDPSLLAPARSRARPSFERSGGAPGGNAAAEMHDMPGHPGQRLDYSDAAQPVRSASRTQFHPPAHDSQR
jgi:hypothetical protein